MQRMSAATTPYTHTQCTSGVTAISLLLTPSLLQVSRWIIREPGAHEHSNNGKLKYKRGSSVPDEEDDDEDKPLPLQHRYIRCACIRIACA